MKGEQNNKPAGEQYQEFDRDLQIWYKLQSQENPSSELDDTIIKMATDAETMSNQTAIDTRQYEAGVASDNEFDNVVRIEKNFWRKNRWILSSAASVMLVVTLVMLSPQSPQKMLSDDVMPMMMQMSESLDEQIQSLQADTVEGASFEARSVDVKGESIPAAKASSHLTLPTKALLGQISSSDVLLPNSVPDKRVRQREAVVNAKQALNHLQNLIGAKQWDEAEKLADKLAKQYPQFKEFEHPQHQRWIKLMTEIAEH